MTKVFQGSRALMLCALVVTSLAQAAVAVAIAWVIQRVFDATLQHPVQASGQFLPHALMFTALGVSAGALEIARAWLAERVGLDYAAALRGALFERLMASSVFALSQRQQASIMLPFVGDLSAIKNWISNGLVRAIAGVLMTGVLITALAFRSLPLAACVAGIAVLAMVALVCLNGPLTAAVRRTRNSRAVLANFVTSTVKSAQTVQACNRMGRERTRLERRNAALMKSGLRLAVLSGATTFVVQITVLAIIAATLGVGSWEVQQGHLTSGLVVAALSLTGFLSTAVRDLGRAFQLWQRASVSMEKIERLLKTELALESVIGDQRMSRKPASLSFREVSIEGLFSNLSVKARPGSIVRIVAESGAGKSSLIQLAARIRDPDGGGVFIGSRNLRDIKLSRLRRCTGVASAAVPLMRGTLRANLRYRDPNVAEEEAARVSEICGLKAIFSRFDQGDEGRISDGAPELSNAERAQVMIARAMLGSPPILLLDDVDAHLNRDTAASIAEALKDYPGVVLMVASSRELKACASELWRLKEGGVKRRKRGEESAVAGEAAQADAEV